jgi:hypothetical protein
MGDKIAKFWASLSVAQGVVLVGALGIAAFTAVHLPPETWATIAEKDPADVGMRIGLLLMAIAGVFTKSTPPQGPTP